MRSHLEEEEGQDYRRKRHHEHIRIRRENRKVIFCRKRTHHD
jgi:hypothetical protein